MASNLKKVAGNSETCSWLWLFMSPPRFCTVRWQGTWKLVHSCGESCRLGTESGESLRSLPIVKQTVQTKVVVVAIDFGTTYSSYAFSFYNDFLEDPLKIKAPIWTKGKQQGVVHGTPTCALFTPEQTFHSFGYEAEEKYSDLAINSQHHDWYYFRHFKMLLYENQDLTVRLELKDDKGNSMPAIEVFSKSIEYLKNRFLTEFEKFQESKPGKVKPEEIYWVLTVPAIWDERAKRFMREAAINAGINTDHLSIALEPEAASLYCRYIPVQRIGDVDDSIVEIKSFVPGDRYVILDAGGGTIDIALHEIQDDETIKELHVANGGRWGGTSIDKKFESLLNDIIGADTMEILSFRCKDDFMDLMYNFEVKKRSLTPETSQKVTIRIPMSIFETYKDLNKVDLSQGEHLQPYLQGRVTFEKDKIRVDAEIMTGLFGESCEHIVNHMKEIFDKRELQDVNKILMVGGFSESKLLQHEMRKAFPNKTFIIPEEAGLAVVKGAVLFGHCPTMVKSRVCRFTYGIEAIRNFQPGLDRPERKIVKKYGKTNYFLCEKSFSIHAHCGESIDVGESRGKHEYVPSEVGEKKLTVSIYRSERRMPVYTDEPLCEKVGDVEVILEDQDNGIDRPVTVEMIFGDTELKVELVEKKTGKRKEASFDCLQRNIYA